MLVNAICGVNKAFHCYREHKDQLEKYNDQQLDKDVVVWNTNDQEFYDADFQEIMKASDELNDQDASYFVI